jgi:hypothetical protein
VLPGNNEAAPTAADLADARAGSAGVATAPLSGAPAHLVPLLVLEAQQRRKVRATEDHACKLVAVFPEQVSGKSCREMAAARPSATITASSM